MPQPPPASGSQADTSYRTGGGSTSTGNNAPTTTGQAWAYSGPDASTMTNETPPGSPDDPKSGVFARIIRINDDGSADVSLSDGRDVTLKTFNGMPIAVRGPSTLERVVPGSAPSKNAPNGEPSMPEAGVGPYDPAPAPYVNSLTGANVPDKGTNVVHQSWIPNPALPQLRSDKQADGSTQVWFDYQARTKQKATVGTIISSYAKEAGSNKPEDIADFNTMRQRLYQAGLAGATPLPNGYSTEFEKAMDEALNDAAASGLTLDAYLTQRITNNPNPPGQDQTGNAIQVTSGEDVQKQVRDNATKILGYQPPQSVIDTLTTQYNALESNTQKESIAAQAKGTGGTTTQVTQPPSLSTFVEGALRQSDPTASQGNQMGSLFSEFSQLLGGSGTPSAGTFQGEQ